MIPQEKEAEHIPSDPSISTHMDTKIKQNNTVFVHTAGTTMYNKSHGILVRHKLHEPHSHFQTREDVKNEM